MSRKFVVQTGEPVLRQKCSEVKNFNSALWNLLDDMKETVRAESGAGLAAPQIGVSLRAVVIDVEEGYYELINPVILSKKANRREPRAVFRSRANRAPSRAPIR